MSADSAARLYQRAEYTHQPNLKTGRHGWLRLTPAYSVKMVEHLMAEHPASHRVFDPFCGTATTVLSAAYRGRDGTTTDVNPFLVWLGGAKVAVYSADSINAARDAGRRACTLVRKRAVPPSPLPAIHNIERWWNPEALSFLQLTKSAIEIVSRAGSAEQDLLNVAFCRTLIAVSNAAFNHQSMSFKQDMQTGFAFSPDFCAIFAADIHFVLNGSAENPTGCAQVRLGDCRFLAESVLGEFDLVVTSPPYANRMSYIRELRPYMYWLGFLATGRNAGDLDWATIGGTWGIATSRLVDWRRDGNSFECDRLSSALARIRGQQHQSAVILSNYVEKYFEDMWRHFQALTDILSKGATIHYIVGNSKFYDTVLDVEKIYAEMLTYLGFTDIVCCPVRKRNSKKELIEFDVSASWRSGFVVSGGVRS